MHHQLDQPDPWVQAGALCHCCVWTCSGGAALVQRERSLTNTSEAWLDRLDLDVRNSGCWRMRPFVIGLRRSWSARDRQGL